MFFKKGQSSINQILVIVIALAVLLAFIPIIISTIFESQFTDSDTRFTDENFTYTGSPLGLANFPLKTTEIIVFNDTDKRVINLSTDPAESGYVILFAGNGTVNITGFISGGQTAVGFNYTAVLQNATGINASSVILLSLMILIFVAGIIVFMVKKLFGK